jgi:cyclophilin family peptidyl-prolyl cis-trans isomerase
LREQVPTADPVVRAALASALQSLQPIEFGNPSVTAHFRCENAQSADILLGRLQHTLTCAGDSFLWRAQTAQAQVLANAAFPAELRLAHLRRLLVAASSDVRVLEALAEPVCLLEPPAARPLVHDLSLQRDPGVLAALLEQLTLHVQHANVLPAAQRRALLQSPFDLPEPVSLEARQHAIALARALRQPLPTTQSTSRAIQRSLQPDAQVPPAEVSPDARSARVRLETSHGTVLLALEGTNSPRAMDFVLRSIQAGRYTGTTFHRVVPAFVAQGGDPRGDGYGGTSELIPTEVGPGRFERGTVGIALGGLDTGGMQFFIMTADSPHLDGRYPWIGRVLEGMDLVDSWLPGEQLTRVTVE